MSKFTTENRARGLCDRCGFTLQLRELRLLTIRTKRVALRVCRRCWEEDHPQLKQGMYPVADVQAVRAPRPDFSGYPASRAVIVAVSSYLSGSERTFATGQVGNIFFPTEVSVTVGAVGVQATGLVAANVSVYTTYGLTSKPYPIAYSESIDPSAAFNSAIVFNNYYVEPLDVSSAFVSATIQNVLLTYGNYQPEAIDASGAFVSASLQSVLLTYNNYAPESIDGSSAFVSATLANVLITYSNYQPESLDVSGAFVSGVLT